MNKYEKWQRTAVPRAKLHVLMHYPFHGLCVQHIQWREEWWPLVRSVRDVAYVLIHEMEMRFWEGAPIRWPRTPWYVRLWRWLTR